MRFQLCGPWLPERFEFHFHLYLHDSFLSEKLEGLKATLDASTDRLATAVDQAPQEEPTE